MTKAMTEAKIVPKTEPAASTNPEAGSSRNADL
jgi:hypothetical protein